MKILVAGIGNIFLGDDGFGVEVANRMMMEPPRDEVVVGDFGIRCYDLAYAIMDGHDATIFVDAVERGAEPGTLYLIELDPGAVGEIDDESVNAHAMNPVTVLQMVKSLGGSPRRLYLVGCERGVLECENGALGLSEHVEAAVPGAIEMIETLIKELLHDYENETTVLRK